MKTSDMIVIGGLAVVGYYLYKAATAAGSAIVNAPGQIGVAASGALFNFLNPNAAGSASTLIATLPNGANAAIPAETVNADGTVSYNGTQYQMLVNSNITSGINKTLVPLTQTQLDNSAAADQFAAF